MSVLDKLHTEILTCLRLLNTLSTLRESGQSFAKMFGHECAPPVLAAQDHLGGLRDALVRIQDCETDAMDELSSASTLLPERPVVTLGRRSARWACELVVRLAREVLQNAFVATSPADRQPEEDIEPEEDALWGACVLPKEYVLEHFDPTCITQENVDDLLKWVSLSIRDSSELERVRAILKAQHREAKSVLKRAEAPASRPEKGRIMSKKSTSQNADLDFAHRTAQNCAKWVLGILACAKSFFEHGENVLNAETDEEMTFTGATTKLLKKLREAVADGERIPQEVKEELADIAADTVTLAKCGVDGTSAHDAAVELGLKLLQMADTGLSKGHSCYLSDFESLSEDGKAAVAALCKIQKWSFRELRGLKKKIEREHLTACRNRSTASSVSRTGEGKGGRKAAEDTTLDDSPTDSPKTYLLTWQEILNALEQKNTPEIRGMVSRLNNNDDGPIILPSRGGQPKVDRAKLIGWWNHLEVDWQNKAHQKSGEKLSTETQYNHGRDGVVAPEIEGSVKRRREDRQP